MPNTSVFSKSPLRTWSPKGLVSQMLNVEGIAWWKIKVVIKDPLFHSITD